MPYTRKEIYPKQRICLRKLTILQADCYYIFTFSNRISLNSTLTWYIKTIYPYKLNLNPTFWEYMEGQHHLNWERFHFSSFEYFTGLLGNSSPTLSTVSLSKFSVIHSQLQSENIKWKILEINNSQGLKLCAFLNSMLKSHAILLCSTQNINDSVSHLVAIWVIRSTIAI